MKRLLGLVDDQQMQPGIRGNLIARQVTGQPETLGAQHTHRTGDTQELRLQLLATMHGEAEDHGHPSPPFR